MTANVQKILSNPFFRANVSILNTNLIEICFEINLTLSRLFFILWHGNEQTSSHHLSQ